MASTNTDSDTDEPRNAWARFWFMRTDPTTLGMMRIITGLIVIYVHLAYCFDLEAFFGPNGWWDAKAANLERQQSPVNVIDWSGAAPETMAPTPLLYDRRIAVFDFLKHLPQEKNERNDAMAFLYFILGSKQSQISEATYHQALIMLRDSAPMLTQQREQIVTELGKDTFAPRKLELTMPDFFAQMTPDERVRVWNQSQRFLKSLPNKNPNFLYVLSWLQNLGPSDRIVLAEFLDKLPEGQPGQDIIEYINVWRQDPRQLFAEGRRTFSLWFHLEDRNAMWVCHFAFIGIFCLFTIGLFTRVTSVLTWMASLCYIHRTQQILFGMDTMMNVLLFYLMIGPSGAALSVDRLIVRFRAGRALFAAAGRSVPWAEAALAGPQPTRMANFAVRLVQIHFCIMYLAAGLAKLKGTTWWNTSAAWLTMANPEFCPVHFRVYEWMLQELASIRPLLAFVMMAVVYATIALEISLPFLIWTRLRPVMMCGSVCMHAGIAAIMGLTCFGLFMMTLLMSYFPAATIRERLGWPAGSGPKLTLRFSRRQQRPERLVGLLRALDLTGQITFEEKPTANGEGPQLVTADGRIWTGHELLPTALHTLVFPQWISWLFWVPGVMIGLRWVAGDAAKTQELDEPAAPTGAHGTATARK